MKLKQVNHDLNTRLWCVPAVVSAITGKPTSEVKRIIQGSTSRTRVLGVEDVHLQLALLASGYAISQPNSGYRVRLKDFLKGRPRSLLNEVLVIGVAQHVIAVQRDMLVDSQYRFGINYRYAHKINKLPVDVYWVIKKYGKATTSLGKPGAKTDDRTTRKPLRSVRGSGSGKTGV